MTRTYTPDRTKFPRSRKAREAFANERNWTCECGCGGAIRDGVDAWQVDHILAKGIRRDDDWSNLQMLLTKCHRAKTKQDVKLIAKSNRVRAMHLGTKAKSRRSFQTNRDGPYKATFSRGTVRRDA